MGKLGSNVGEFGAVGEQKITYVMWLSINFLCRSICLVAPEFQEYAKLNFSIITKNIIC